MKILNLDFIVGFIFMTLILSFVIKDPILKSTSVETEDEQAWRQGKKFYYNILLKDVALSEKIELVLEVGDRDIAIDEVTILGNSAILRWKWSAGVNINIQTCNNIPEGKSNSTVNSSSGANLCLNPVYTGSWVDVFEEVEAVAWEGHFNRVKMLEPIVTRKLALEANTTHLFYIDNGASDSPDIIIKVFFEVL